MTAQTLTPLLASSAATITGAAVVLASPTRAGITIAGTALAVAFVIAEAFRDTGKPRSWPVNATKIICAVICGISLPGMLREIFQGNTWVQSLETLWETWLLTSFLCGIFGWTLIYTSRAIFNRAVDRAAHSKAVTMIAGPDNSPAPNNGTASSGTVSTTVSTTVTSSPAPAGPANLSPAAAAAWNNNSTPPASPPSSSTSAV